MAKTETTARGRFKYCAYWGTWNLVLTDRNVVGLPRLQRERMSGFTVEISLSPVNGWTRAIAAGLDPMDWPSVRIHCTANEPNDIVADDLPLEAEIELTEQIGFDLVAWLLDPKTEILGKIDWDEFRRINNGGAPLRQCLLKAYRHSMPANRPSESMARLNQHLKAA